VLGADGVGHQLLGALDHLPRPGPVVQSGRGQQVVAEDVVAQHGPHAGIGATAVLVTGWRDGGVLAAVVVRQGVEHGRLVVVHDLLQRRWERAVWASGGGARLLHEAQQGR
jgi:hypothetical protein